MDTLTPVGRRFAGPPTSMMGGVSGDHHNHPPPPPMQHLQPGTFWYPPPPSSAPPGDPHYPPPRNLQQHPPPPMPSGPFPPHPPPHYPHQQQQQPPWAPLPDHLQQQFPPSNVPPAIPPPLGMHPGAPSAAAGSPHLPGVPPPNPPYPVTPPMYPPPALSHAPHAPPPPLPPATLPHAYSQASQTWETLPWHPTQGWDHTATKIQYNNEEDWAARARAWAAANSATEDLSMQPQFMPSGSGTTNNVYHDQYQHSTGPPFMDSPHPMHSAPDKHFPDSAIDLHRRVNDSREASLSSMSYSVTNFPTYDSRDEGSAADTSVTVSPPKRIFSSSTSVNVQEVPSSYSSFSGNMETADQFEKLNMPSHLSSPTIVPGRMSTSSVKPSAREQLHQPYRDPSVEYSDASDRSQGIEQAPFDQDQTQYIASANAGQGRFVDQSATSSSVHDWAQAITPGHVFPHVSPVPPVHQFDSSSISSSLPGHPAQVFGRIQGPNFHPVVSSVGASFGFDAGSSLHPPAAFPVDAIEAFNLSDRPKKAAVPNWLRDEIIKKKATIATSTQEYQDGGSHSILAEVNDQVSRKDELADSKSIESTRSTEDEDEDEDDMEAVRSAAINQEIKRVLTDVLLKVTDELFEEIATKVLNEDELEVDHNAAIAKLKNSVSPPPSTPPKPSAKVIVPATTIAGKSSAIGHSSLASSGGDILGLANYASDDDSDELQGTNMPFSGKVYDSSDQHGAHDVTSEDTFKKEKASVQVAAKKPDGGSLDVENGSRNSAGCSGVSKHENRSEVVDPGRLVKSLDGGIAHEQKALREKLELGSESAHGHLDNGKLKVGLVSEYRSKSSSCDVLQDEKDPLDRNVIKKVELVSAKSNLGESGSENLKRQLDRDKLLEKIDERVISKRRSKDHNSKQATDLGDSESKGALYCGKDMNDKRASWRDKRDRMKDDHWKRERTRDEKEDRFKQVTKDSCRHKGRQTSSPSTRGRNGGDNSLGSPSDGSGGEISLTSRKRKLQSSRQSLSPSPTRSRRQILRSPHSKHTQRRHSPYSHVDTRRRRSRSISPTHRRRPGHNR